MADKGLQELLSSGSLTRDRAMRLARQIAEELSAAHQHGVFHGALTLDKVVLIGSGKKERALLNGFGECPGGQADADVRAFGQLLEALLPSHRLAAECMAANANDRPYSFEFVLEELQGFRSCRTWIGSALIGAATAAFALYEMSRAYPNFISL